MSAGAAMACQVCSVATRDAVNTEPALGCEGAPPYTCSAHSSMWEHRHRHRHKEGGSAVPLDAAADANAHALRYAAATGRVVLTTRHVAWKSLSDATHGTRGIDG